MMVDRGEVSALRRCGRPLSNTHLRMRRGDLAVVREADARIPEPLSRGAANQNVVLGFLCVRGGGVVG
jgi:hypothetical protein